tara:strand:+ start:472 stop:639 length:168 start_codon:yes stop_codon:yes gene_type:complete
MAGPNLEWDKMEYRLKNGAKVTRIREVVFDNYDFGDYEHLTDDETDEYYGFSDYY